MQMRQLKESILYVIKNGSEAGLKLEKQIQEDVVEVKGYQPPAPKVGM